MEPNMYCGASSRHIHCEEYNFKIGEVLKIFGREEKDETTTWLDLRHCTGTLDSRSLSLLPKLDYLNITDSTLEILPKAFENLAKLRALDFRKSKVSICKEIFEGCTVKHLFIEGLSIPDTDCLSHLKDLDMLTFEKCHFNKFSGNILSNLRSLEYLFIKQCNIESLDDFHNDAQQLPNLFISENNIGEFNYKTILKMQNLKWLDLFGNKTSTQINYEEFQKLPKLEAIGFDVATSLNLDFSSFPSLKKVCIGSWGGEATEEEVELVKKVESQKLEYEYQIYGNHEVDMSEVQICA